MANVPISAFTVGANTTGIGASGYSLTGSAANSYIDLAGTWNTSGTPTAIKLNITDTASNANSLLLDLQTGGSTKFSVVKDGSLLVTGSATSNVAQIRSPVYANTGIRWDGGGYVLTFLAAGVAVKLDQNQNIILDDPRFKFGWSAVSGGGLDTVLNRDAAQTLAQRNSTNAQTFRVYNTFTDASNYERGKMEWASNVLRIGTEKAGTGTARALEFQTDGTTRLTIQANGNASFSSDVFAGSSAFLGFGSRGGFRAASDGVIAVYNNAQSDFGRLQFGGTTSSFPALKRSTASLQAVLADDTGFTNIQGKLTTETAYTAGAPTATGYLVLYDSTGTAYKVPAVAV